MVNWLSGWSAQSAWRKAKTADSYWLMEKEYRSADSRYSQFLNSFPCMNR